MQTLDARETNSSIIRDTRLSSRLVFGLLLSIGGLLATWPLAAQTFSASVWEPYTDKYGLIYSQLVNPPPPPFIAGPSNNNGLLYTAEACVIMQLRGVAYDRAQITSGVKESQVVPGLFNHSPVNHEDTEGPDDYIGLGALAGVCGFHDVARDILDYGKPNDQASGSTLAALNPVGPGHSLLALLQKGLRPGAPVPYNYNNTDPGVFTLKTWLGRSPAIITHLKLAAGDHPTRSEFAVWSAALEFSGESGIKDPAHSNQSAWLQSWLMVLTYEMSHYHSFVADAAVDRWRTLMYQRYPGGAQQPSGIKQSMTQYLNEGRDENPLSEENPLSQFIEDFSYKRDTTAVMVDSDNKDASLVSALKGLLSMHCGRGTASAPCLNDNDFSQANFLMAFNLAFSNADTTLEATKDTIATHTLLLNSHVTAARDSKVVIDALNVQTDHLQKEIDPLQGTLGKLVALKKVTPDRVPGPGICLTPCLAKVFGKCHPPQAHIPCPLQPNSEFVNLVKSINDLTVHLNNLEGMKGHAQKELAEAQGGLEKETKYSDKLTKELVQLGQDLKDFQKNRDAAKDGLEGAQAAVQNLIPGLVLPSDQ